MSQTIQVPAPPIAPPTEEVVLTHAVYFTELGSKCFMAAFAGKHPAQEFISARKKWAGTREDWYEIREL